jgi:hypothetical protein
LGHQNIKHLHTREELLQALAALDAGASDDQKTDEDEEDSPSRRTSSQSKSESRRKRKRTSAWLHAEPGSRPSASRLRVTKTKSSLLQQLSKLRKRAQNWERLSSRSLAHSNARQRRLEAYPKTPRSPSYWTPPRSLPSPTLPGLLSRFALQAEPDQATAPAVARLPAMLAQTPPLPPALGPIQALPCPFPTAATFNNTKILAASQGPHSPLHPQGSLFPGPALLYFFDLPLADPPQDPLGCRQRQESSGKGPPIPRLSTLPAGVPCQSQACVSTGNAPAPTNRTANLVRDRHTSTQALRPASSSFLARQIRKTATNTPITLRVQELIDLCPEVRREFTRFPAEAVTHLAEERGQDYGIARTLSSSPTRHTKQPLLVSRVRATIQGHPQTVIINSGCSGFMMCQGAVRQCNLISRIDRQGAEQRCFRVANGGRCLFGGIIRDVTVDSDSL